MFLPYLLYFFNIINVITIITPIITPEIIPYIMRENTSPIKFTGYFTFRYDTF